MAGHEAQPMQVGGRSFKETKGKHCFHASRYHTVELLTSGYHEIQRSKWLKNKIDNFFGIKT